MAGSRLPAGREVEVWSSFEGTWVAGFEVAGADADGEPRYLIRRRSDGVILPERFDGDRIRRREGG